MGQKQRKRAANVGGKLSEQLRLPARNLVIDGIDNDQVDSPYSMPDSIALQARIVVGSCTSKEEATIRSIAENGVLVPVDIKWRDDIPVVIDGRKRVLFSREAERRQFNAGDRLELGTFQVQTHEPVAESAAVAREGNLRRHDPSILELGKYAEQLRATYEDKDAAKLMDWTELTLKKYRTVYTDSCEELKAAILEKAWGISAAYKIARLSPALQPAAVAAALAGKKPEDAARAAEGKAAPIRLIGKVKRKKAAKQALEQGLDQSVVELLEVLAQTRKVTEISDPEIRKLFGVEPWQE
jgi:hypothetical protein